MVTWPSEAFHSAAHSAVQEASLIFAHGMKVKTSRRGGATDSAAAESHRTGSIVEVRPSLAPPLLYHGSATDAGSVARLAGQAPAGAASRPVDRSLREHPLCVADRQGQVAHTRGSGKAVVSTPSEEQRMAIIFLLPWLEEPENFDSCTEKCCPPIMRGSVHVPGTS